MLAVITGNGFNRFPASLEAKPLKRLCAGGAANTGLKPGVNERLQETEMRLCGGKMEPTHVGCYVAGY
jgi:hypothetical protein